MQSGQKEIECKKNETVYKAEAASVKWTTRCKCVKWIRWCMMPRLQTEILLSESSRCLISDSSTTCLSFRISQIRNEVVDLVDPLCCSVLVNPRWSSDPSSKSLVTIMSINKIASEKIALYRLKCDRLPGVKC